MVLSPIWTLANPFSVVQPDKWDHISPFLKPSMPSKHIHSQIFMFYDAASKGFMFHQIANIYCLNA